MTGTIKEIEIKIIDKKHIITVTSLCSLRKA